MSAERSDSPTGDPEIVLNENEGWTVGRVGQTRMLPSQVLRALWR